MIESEEEVDYLLGKIDPYNLNKMTYSEIVQLLSSHMVADDYNNHIPVLEKFSNANNDAPMPEEDEEAEEIEQQEQN